MAVISWMAGLFYLPRLFVYHVERGASAEMSATFKVMEEKLLRVIMNPAMIVAWVTGLGMAAMPWVLDPGAIWPYSKFAADRHDVVPHLVRPAPADFRGGRQHALTGRQYRMMNEVPTLMMVIIVISVVVKI